MATSEPRATTAEISQDLAEKVCAQSNQVVEKVIAFSDDDVPQYLAKLQSFEEQSRKVEFIVK